MDHRNDVLWPRKVEGVAGCYGWLYIYIYTYIYIHIYIYNGWLVIIVLDGFFFFFVN